MESLGNFQARKLDWVYSNGHQKRNSHASRRGSRGSNATSPYAARSISPTALRAPSPVNPGHATTPKEGTGDVLHLETPVGTASDQNGLLTVTVPTVHAPITDGVRQDVTRTYGRNQRISKALLAVIARKSILFCRAQAKTKLIN